MALNRYISTVLIFVIFLILPSLGYLYAAPVKLQPSLIGPMAGSITMRSAKIWVQLENLQEDKQYQTYIEYEPIPKSGYITKPIKNKTSVIEINAKNRNHIWQINDLEPATSYQYKIHIKNLNQYITSKAFIFTTEELWQWRKDPPDIRVLASSCAYTNEAEDDRPGKPYGQGNQIFQTMAKQKPNFTLWLGDNIYLREPDFGDSIAMARRYDKWRSLPELQELLQTGSHLAIWDDHDYGSNDSNSSNPFKDISLKLFKKYWPNPSFGLPSLPGIFTQDKTSDVEFFALDDRWYRDNEKLIDESKHMFGVDQLRWLKNALLSSTATWKIIISGSQVLNVNNKYEGWNHFDKEQSEFLQWLELQKIPGVMLMTGDRHFSVLLKKDRISSYPLYELTCSPSTAGSFKNALQEVQGSALVVPGSVVTENNYCDLEFSGKMGERKLQITIRNVTGNSLFSTTISQTILR